MYRGRLARTGWFGRRAAFPRARPTVTPPPVPGGLFIAPAGWLALAVAMVLPLSAGSQERGTLPELRTAAERSGYTRHTGHDEMMEYLVQARRLAVDMELGSYGTTLEGRELPWALFSRPRVTSPAEAHGSGKPVVLLGANVHGFNHVMRETLLVVIRELGTPGTELNDLLDHVIVIVAPSKNPDGLEAGSRFNARGADLNRDYMALLEPETAAFVGSLLNRWAPHLSVDGHDGGDVQYGGAYPYHLLYQGPGLAGADPALGSLADEALLPWITTRLEEAGYRSFYWSRGDSREWIVGGSAPRMGRNYGGLSGKLTVLFEVTAWSGLDGGVRVGDAAVRALLTWAGANAALLVETVRDARARAASLPAGAEDGGTPVEERMEAGPLQPTWEIPDPEREGALLTITDGLFRYRPVGTRFRSRPWAWVLPPEAEALVDLLRRHGIAVERLTEPVEAEVGVYTIRGVRWEAGENLNRSAPRIVVGEELSVARTLPRGAWVVRSGQSLGRVAAHLLEVEATDSAAWWGFLTALLPPDGYGYAGRVDHEDPPPLVPIVKLMEPTPLPLWTP